MAELPQNRRAWAREILTLTSAVEAEEAEVAEMEDQAVQLKAWPLSRHFGFGATILGPS